MKAKEFLKSKGDLGHKYAHQELEEICEWLEQYAQQREKETAKDFALWFMYERQNKGRWDKNNSELFDEWKSKH